MNKAEAALRTVLEATVYLRRLVADDPDCFGVEVINIERLPLGPSERNTLLLDLADGTTIRLDVERYVR